MNKNLRNFYILFFLIIILVAAGFFILIHKVNNLESLEANNIIPTSTNNFASTTILENNPQIPTSSSPLETSTPSSSAPTSNNLPHPSLSINSNILFNAVAYSISTNDQYAVTVMINKVTQNTDGSFTVGLKVFTDSATNYSSLDIENLIQVFNQEGSNISANKVIGAFKAMQPQSSIDGYLTFSIPHPTNSIILQVGPTDNPSFYQFDFSKGTYEQITVG